MPVLRTFAIVLLLGLVALPVMARPSLAADANARGCLTKAEQRAAVAANKAVPLAAAIRTLRERGHRAEVVRAELCNRNEKLVYMLTLLARSGKVTRATVDATDGEPINGL